MTVYLPDSPVVNPDIKSVTGQPVSNWDNVSYRHQKLYIIIPIYNEEKQLY